MEFSNIARFAERVTRKQEEQGRPLFEYDFQVHHLVHDLLYSVYPELDALATLPCGGLVSGL